jgi:hypothetical protein
MNCEASDDFCIAEDSVVQSWTEEIVALMRYDITPGVVGAVRTSVWYCHRNSQEVLGASVVSLCQR